ncbi:diadenylate cyclase CdaA [Sorangium sp. So ce1335]|uniref:diadenylate cyclase CdaA n=1 Tax=Sorangium sp. So ce1335 TaxID=3133335 RepID=UPI003F61C87C
MTDGFLRLFAARPVAQIARDLVDIFIVAYVVYRALLVLRGTRAMQMGLGLGIVFLIYLGAKVFGLTTLLNLLSWLLSSIILIVVVVFQNDIRRALIRVGGSNWFTSGREQQSRVIDEVVAAATELARHRMGAIIAFEQDANVLEFVKSEGIHIDSVVTRELLVSLFVPESVNKLHDGAVLIRDLKIARAGVFFPMPETKILDASLGSRHRAALGITEETDAVVVVVSEERGTISFCFSGNIVSNLDGQSLRHALLGLFGRSSRRRRFAKKVAQGGRTSLPTPPVRSPAAGAPAGAAAPGHEPPKPAAPKPAAPTPPAPPAPPTPMEGKPATAITKTSSMIKGPAEGEARTMSRMSTSTPMRSGAEARASLGSSAEVRSPAAAQAPQDGDRPSSERGRPAMVDVPAGATDSPVPSQRTFVPTGQAAATAASNAATAASNAATAASKGSADGMPPRDEP